MKAYLIDPFIRVITEVATTGELDDIYRLTGCSIVEAVYLNQDGDAVFVDEEGLLGDLSKQAFFRLNGSTAEAVLAGRGLVLGADEEGNSTEPTLTPAALKSMISWTTLDALRAERH